MDDNMIWLENLLKEKSQENCIIQVLNVERKPATLKGDNYSGELHRIIVEVLLRCGRNVKRSLIEKNIPPEENRKMVFETLGIFKKEILMYSDILPKMEDIMREFGDHTEFMWPKCLYFREFDQIILNDLTEDGYIMKNRRQGLDLEHCLHVVRCLAKFHALSVVMNERGLICIEAFKEHLFANSYSQELNKQFQIDAFLRLADLVDTWEPKWKSVAEKIRLEIAPNIMKLLKNEFKFDENRFNVLCHGDCWSNNMLFKPGVDGVTPISVKFLDFQLSCYNSPAFDLKYFLTMSPTKEVRMNSIKHILKVYHESLCKELKFYSYEGDIITFDELLEEMQRIIYFGLTTAVSILPIVLMENTQDIPDMEKLTKDVLEKMPIDKDSWPEYFKPNPTFVEYIRLILAEAFNNVI